jgi:hypothetical protein
MNHLMKESISGVIEGFSSRNVDGIRDAASSLMFSVDELAIIVSRASNSDGDRLKFSSEVVSVELIKPTP